MASFGWPSGRHTGDGRQRGLLGGAARAMPSESVRRISNLSHPSSTRYRVPASAPTSSYCQQDGLQQPIGVRSADRQRRSGFKPVQLLQQFRLLPHDSLPCGRGARFEKMAPGRTAGYLMQTALTLRGSQVRPQGISDAVLLECTCLPARRRQIIRPPGRFEPFLDFVGADQQFVQPLPRPCSRYWHTGRSLWAIEQSSHRYR